MMARGSSSSREGPRWLPDFLTGDYFSHCGKHPSAKNERNHFCIDCCVDGPMCHIGLLHEHAGHKSLQVRRASHMDAVRVHDLQKLADISDIQTYTINGAKIVFLLSRPQEKVSRGATHWCKSCNRTLTDATSFCSISCKLAAVQWDSSVSLGFSGDSKENEHVDLASESAALAASSAAAPARARTCCLEDEELLVKAKILGPTQQQKLSKAGKKRALLPLKKRKLDHHLETMQNGILNAGTSSYGSEDESPPSPNSVLIPENTRHCPQSPQHSGNSHSYSNLAPSTPQKHEFSAGLRSRQRKGFPHRSPFA